MVQSKGSAPDLGHQMKESLLTSSFGEVFVFVFATDQFLHRGVGEDPVEGGEGEGREEPDVDFVS